jgi:hypothetical protein
VSTVAVVGWVDQDEVYLYWPEAEDLDPTVLTTYLQTAYVQCVAILPPEYLVPYPVPIPPNYIKAQIDQAHALWRANVAGSGDQIGSEGLTVTVYPMDWHVQNELRPKTVGRVM